MKDLQKLALAAAVLAVLWLWGQGSQQAAHAARPVPHTTAQAVHRG
jgi:hypothetical protein